MYNVYINMHSTDKEIIFMIELSVRNITYPSSNKLRVVDTQFPITTESPLILFHYSTNIGFTNLSMTR